MLGFGAVWGAVAAWWLPRGPLTTTEALVTMALSVLVGAAAGFLSGTRWAIVFTPAAFVAAFELTRLSATGPTVDGIHVSTYGLLALVTGRGILTLLTAVPLALGATLGAAARRRRTRADAGDGAQPGKRHLAGRVVRGAFVFVVALGLIGFAVALAVPARTAPVAAGGISELTTVEVGDHELGLMVRGQNTDAPVLLFLAGGPGGSELGAMRRHLPALEDHFVVATLDQRGTGRSYSALDPTGTLTLDSAISDVLAVTDYLRERFDRDRVLLVGQSWGSLLGVLAVTAMPDVYSGFVGVGQMVSLAQTDQIFYADTLEWARSTGNDALAAKLESIGPPPYDDMLNYETALSYEHQVYPYDHSANSEGEGGFSENFLVEEYSLLDKVHLLGAFTDTFSVIYPQAQDVDLRRIASRIDVPVFFVQGAHEAPGRVRPFEQWYDQLRAPSKDVIVLATSGHRPMFEQPDQFVGYLNDTVLPAIAQD